jgi:toxin-antitoxin system PIN domain toxin
MRALLDVNVLVALLDMHHAAHRAAVQWMSQHGALGWAACPITQNGCVRILSGATYRSAFTVNAVVDRLRTAAGMPQHEFWPDDVSLLDSGRIDESRVHGASQLTDLYLLALAVSRGGRLVTFDQRITSTAVLGARPEHLVVI